jgi:hypothetical protein
VILLLLITWILVGSVVALVIGRLFALSHADIVGVEMMASEYRAAATQYPTAAAPKWRFRVRSAKGRCDTCAAIASCVTKMPGTEQCDVRYRAITAN